MHVESYNHLKRNKKKKKGTWRKRTSFAKVFYGIFRLFCPESNPKCEKEMESLCFTVSNPPPCGDFPARITTLPPY